MVILATGFEPFGGQAVNPSWLAVQALGDTIAGARIVKAQLPVVWFQAIEALLSLVREHRPDQILLAGQAGGVDRIRIERVAVNLCESAAPDNAGRVIERAPIVEGAPDAYFSSFSDRAILSALQRADIPTAYSFSAGTYLCNHTLYGALHFAPDCKSGFIHLPYLPEQAAEGVASMPLKRQARALTLCIEGMVNGA